jgi:hypothetical protein
MVHLSATRYSCIAILRVSVVSFASITFYVPSQLVFIVYFVMIQSGNFWIQPRSLFRYFILERLGCLTPMIFITVLASYSI